MSALVYAAIPAFFVLITLEIRRHRELRRAGRRDLVGYERRDTAASLWMGVGNVVVAAAAHGSILALFLFVYEHRIFEIGTGPFAWIALFLAEDFVYYCWHRSSHEVRLLWAAHENHHSSRHYNLSTALRQSWTTPFTTVPFYLCLPLLGFHPLMVQTQVAVSLLYQFWLHTELVGSLGPFEWLFNTPSHHRVHHGTQVEYLDRNHAGILIVWDRLFGTFEPELAPVRYGLTKDIDTFAPFRIAFHEWAAMARQASGARSLREALGYVLRPPGWSPDGSTLTAGQLRAARSPAG
jgi:sterol desaturase/sphingolipid hydroxylase (fatty acid hydroxylase superfamily)